MRVHPTRARAAGVFLAACMLTTACAPLQALNDLPRLDPEDLKVQLTPQTSRIFDSAGRQLTTFHGAINRTVVEMERIPQHLRDAVVAIEDERFYEHEGLDIKGIVRAALTNIEEGEISQGGSTITQQLVKNRIIAPANGKVPDTIERKLDEAALARQAEAEFTKKEILERYLNTVYFGEGAYGVQAAAKTFFGKSVEKLNLREAALLAGLIRSPEFYDPFDNPKRSERRRSVVLKKMADLGTISRSRADGISKKSLSLVKRPSQKRHPAPYFVDYVKRLLVYHPDFSFLGKSPAERSKKLYTGGLEIYTTVSRRIQREAERAIDGILSEPGDPYGALVAIDPRNGRVKAMVGGRDFFDRRGDFAKLNLAIGGEPGLGSTKGPNGGPRAAAGTGRQAGSAFKPFALAEALAQGIPLGRTFPAPPCRTFEGVNAGGDWEVCNYGSASYGTLSLLDATVMSVNVVFAKLILELGPASVVKMARTLGIGTDLAAVPSATLGTNPVNPLGMAEAFGTFATNGRHHEPVAIRKIVDPSGKVIYRDKSIPQQRMNPGVAYLTTQALQQVIERGTGTAADIGRPAAGKTGTAQEYRDAWFVGYVPQLVASVWVGYPSASIEMKTSCSTADTRVCRPTRVTVSGGSWPAQIWQAFMSGALAPYPVKGFRVPKDGLEKVVIDSRTGCPATGYTSSSYAVETYQIEGTGPGEKECARRLAELQAAIEAARDRRRAKKEKEARDEGPGNSDKKKKDEDD